MTEFANFGEGDHEIYGVTAGYGDSWSTPISAEPIDELPFHLTRFHGCDWRPRWENVD